MKKRINSRSKGCRGERQWRDRLREAGYDARRGQQYSGGHDSPDVVCPSMRGFHVEVKAVEKLNVRGAMEQANDDAKGKLAYLAWLKNFCPTYVMLRDDDFFTILSYCDLEALNDHYAPYPEKGSIGPLEQ